jgi:anti-sigma regulatory factor (Ser/Thr protein kinase)
MIPARLAGSTGRHWLEPAAEMAYLASGNWPLSPDLAPRRSTRVPRIATRAPDVDAGAVRAARDFTIATLHRWGVTERSDDIAIVVSELLTNALQHALPGSGGPRPRSPIRLGLLQPGPCVLCAVADPSRVAPVPKTPDSLAETGRGLHIICALSDKWGYTTPSDMGKIVWAMFSTLPTLPRPRLLRPTQPPPACSSQHPRSCEHRPAGCRPDDVEDQ